MADTPRTRPDDFSIHDIAMIADMSLAGEDNHLDRVEYNGLCRISLLARNPAYVAFMALTRTIPSWVVSKTASMTAELIEYLQKEHKISAEAAEWVSELVIDLFVTIKAGEDFEAAVEVAAKASIEASLAESEVQSRLEVAIAEGLDVSELEEEFYRAQDRLSACVNHLEKLHTAQDEMVAQEDAAREQLDVVDFLLQTDVLDGFTSSTGPTST